MSPSTVKSKKPIRSPLFYVGDKYKLMPQLQELFPECITNYVEPFVGGGSSFLNTKAEKYYLNDLDTWIVKIHNELIKYSKKNDVNGFIEDIYKIIDKYGLTCSLRGKDVPEGYRQKYIKTYFAKANKDAYCRMRGDFNSDQSNIKLLYTLLIYGFNHMIRFNSAGDFNLPVGNVDFNKNVEKALRDYMELCADRDVTLLNKDYKDFLKDIELIPGKTYVYFDPPYLISGSEYNKLWNGRNERELYACIDELDRRGIKFGLTNLVSHKGKTNDILCDWARKYNIYNIQSNYISFNDNTIKNNSKEVFITNYGRK